MRPPARSRGAVLLLGAWLLAGVALGAGCGGVRAAPPNCGLGGGARAGPPGAELAYSCALATRGRAAGGDLFVLGTDGAPARHLTADFAWDYGPAWSPDGSSLAFGSTRDGSPNLYLMDAAGAHVHRLTSALAREEGPAWSPDGRRLAFTSGRDGIFGPLGVVRRHSSLFVLDLGSGAVTRLVAVAGYAGDAAWSPDGGRLAFVSDRGGRVDIWTVAADGTGLQRLTSDASDHLRPAWSPDGRRLAYQVGGTPQDPSGGRIWVMDADGRNAHQLMSGEGHQPAWSPVGGWIAFASTRDGQPNLWLVPAAGGQAVQLTHDSAAKFRPAWRPL